MKNLALAIGFIVSFTLGGILTTYFTTDPLDVNRDGQANIVDLSVLSAKLNERNGCIASAYQATKNGFEFDISECE